MAEQKPEDILFAAEQIVFDLIHRPVEPVPASVKVLLEELYKLITDDKVMLGEISKSITLLKNHYVDLVEAVAKGDDEQIEAAFQGMEEWMGPLDHYNVNLMVLTDDANDKIMNLLGSDDVSKKVAEKLTQVKDLLHKAREAVKEVPPKIGALDHLILRLDVVTEDPREAENLITSAGKLINFIDEKINAAS